MTKTIFFFSILFLFGITSCCDSEPIVPPECNADCTNRPHFGQPIYNYGGTVYLGGGKVSVRLDSIGEAGSIAFLFCDFPDSAKQNALHVVLSFQPVQLCPSESDTQGGRGYAKLIYLRKL